MSSTFSRSGSSSVCILTNAGSCTLGGSAATSAGADPSPAGVTAADGASWTVGTPDSGVGPAAEAVGLTTALAASASQGATPRRAGESVGSASSSLSSCRRSHDAVSLQTSENSVALLRMQFINLRTGAEG